jgi:hypothetical protein
MALPERAILDSFYYGYLREGRLQGAGDPDALRYPADPTITPREKRQLSMGNDTMREVTQQPANRFLIDVIRDFWTFSEISRVMSIVLCQQKETLDKKLHRDRIVVKFT